MTAIRGILALSMVGWLVTAHAELVPGLPVYSMDGSVDTSRTVAGFQAEVWQILTPSPANLTGMTVDDEGRVWIAWQSDVLEQDGEYYRLVRSDVFLGRLEDGGVEIVVPVTPRDPDTWWSYAIASGPGGPWCAINMRAYDYDMETIHVFPCDDTEAGSIQDRRIHSDRRWQLEFVDGEPVILEETEGGLQAYWVRSDLAQEIHTVKALGVSLYQRGPIHVAQVGTVLAVVWGGSISFPHTLGWTESYNFLSIHRDGRWETEQVLTAYSADASHDDEVLRPDQTRLLSFAQAMDIGSDGGSLIYMPFIQDDEAPQAEPDHVASADEYAWVPFSINVSPRVRAYEAATLDTVEEWILGYEERREIVGPTTHVAVTVGHERVGFAVTRVGNLDLWVLTGGSWYGPYRIASGISMSSEYHFAMASGISGPGIAVDGEGSYWLAWDREGTVHVARVSPEELGLDAPTGITRGEGPRSPMLAQNAPNPFNAQTVIEAHVPSGAGTRIDIFNLRAQRVRSLALPPGSSQVLWDGTDDAGRSVASGVYLYRLQEGDHTWAFRRMALIR